MSRLASVGTHPAGQDPGRAASATPTGADGRMAPTPSRNRGWCMNGSDVPTEIDASLLAEALQRGADVSVLERDRAVRAPDPRLQRPVVRGLAVGPAGDVVGEHREMVRDDRVVLPVRRIRRRHAAMLGGSGGGRHRSPCDAASGFQAAWWVPALRGCAPAAGKVEGGAAPLRPGQCARELRPGQRVRAGGPSGRSRRYGFSGRAVIATLTSASGSAAR